MSAAIERLLNEIQVAEMIDVKPQTLQSWRATGRYGLPYIRVGRLIRYRLADVEAWLLSRTTNGTVADE